MKTNTKRAGETPVRVPGHLPLFAGLALLAACASDPPPPPQPPPPVPAAESPSPAPEVAAAPVAEQTETPAAAEPECQAADDCKKVREPGAGLQWACESARCVEQSVPEPPKAEATAEAEKTPKKTAKVKGGKKK
jgi:hypothetical protein